MGRHISSYRELLFSKVECIAFYVKNEPAKNIELTPSPTVRRENKCLATKASDREPCRQVSDSTTMMKAESLIPQGVTERGRNRLRFTHR